MDLERTLTSREAINRHLQAELDDTTGKWGVKVTRVEIKAIEPPPSIRDAMEKQMRAERDRRAAILNAEGVKQSQILTAEGEKQAAVLRADGERQARILQAEGQAKAVRTVFEAVHAANPDSKVLAYQYLQALPRIAEGSANKVWVVPVEFARALEGLGGALGNLQSLAGGGPLQREGERPAGEVTAEEARAAAEDAAQAAQAVQEEVREAERTTGRPPRPGYPPVSRPGPPRCSAPSRSTSVGERSTSSVTGAPASVAGLPAQPSAGGEVRVVTDPDDPRIADYRALTDVALRTRWEPPHGLFIAEGELVLRRALARRIPAPLVLVDAQAGGDRSLTWRSAGLRRRPPRCWSR